MCRNISLIKTIENRQKPGTWKWELNIIIFILIMVVFAKTFIAAVVQMCFVKKMFLEISQNSQENTCARVSFLIKLQTQATPFLKEHLWWLLLHLVHIIKRWNKKGIHLLLKSRLLLLLFDNPNFYKIFSIQPLLPNFENPIQSGFLMASWDYRSNLLKFADY